MITKCVEHVNGILEYVGTLNIHSFATYVSEYDETLSYFFLYSIRCK